MRCDVPPGAFWAKRKPRAQPTDWHPLAEHCIDVAACCEALLGLPAVRVKLGRLAGTVDWPEAWTARLTVLAMLHDFGKANAGFQEQTPHAGHIKQAAAILRDPDKFAAAGLDIFAGWGVDARELLAVMLAHHGEPPDISNPPQMEALWTAAAIAGVGALVNTALSEWPEVASKFAPPFPDYPRFWHAVLGLLQLSDWIGSDDRSDAFPYAIETDGPRLPPARARAASLFRTTGLDVTALRQRFSTAPEFSAVSGYEAFAIQRAAAEAPGPIVVLEAETGSGKTEAALYRFARLFAAGKVDSLYFALPTRAAATQIHGRVEAAIKLMFPDPGPRPIVVRALPGDAGADGVTLRSIGRFEVEWPDDPGELARRKRWAAEQPKRYLAATIAIGTIDQALLGAVKVKHAQMRSFCLMRSLLVVDEVHASDAYMEGLLANLLAQHARAGGEALLLSATLGGASRTRLLLGHLMCHRKIKQRQPGVAEARDIAYPALSWIAGGEIITGTHASRGGNKRVTVEPATIIGQPEAIARQALAAAAAGAKVLVLRNTVKDAVATAKALHELAPGHPALFAVNGVPTLHHSRFARVDRRLLDEAAEARIGKVRPDGPLVLAGTQTLEQSLDIDADLLICDLAPMDVLLQRIGRLHRHSRDNRPAGFQQARVVILVPDTFEASLSAVARGFSGPHGLGGFVYADLRSLAATRQAIGEGAVWDIPAMNRALVEDATHPDALEALAEELAKSDPRWTKAQNSAEGKVISLTQSSQNAVLDWNQSVSDFKVAEDKIGTRLGQRDIEIEFAPAPIGPFGTAIERLVIPAFLLKGETTNLLPLNVVQNSNGFSFRLGETMFLYDSYGLQTIPL